MQYVIGDLATVTSLSAQVDLAMGYPVYGRGEDGALVLPARGQDPATVLGVTLRWREVTVADSDATKGYLIADAMNGPFITTALTDPAFGSLSLVDALPTGWLPAAGPL